MIGEKKQYRWKTSPNIFVQIDNHKKTIFNDPLYNTYFRFNCRICSVYSFILQINCIFVRKIDNAQAQSPIVDLFLCSRFLWKKKVFFHALHIVLIYPFHSSNQLGRLCTRRFINEYSHESVMKFRHTAHRTIINCEHYGPYV